MARADSTDPLGQQLNVLAELRNAFCDTCSAAVSILRSNPTDTEQFAKRVATFAMQAVRSNAADGQAGLLMSGYWRQCVEVNARTARFPAYAVFNQLIVDVIRDFVAPTVGRLPKPVDEGALANALIEDWNQTGVPELKLTLAADSIWAVNRALEQDINRRHDRLILPANPQALLESQIALLGELLEAVQAATGEAKRVINTDPADQRVLAQRIARFVMVEGTRLNHAISEANLLVSWQSAVEISSAHGRIGAFTAFIGMVESIWHTVDVATGKKSQIGMSHDEVVDALLRHWAVTSVPRLENSLSVFDVDIAATGVNRDIRERYNELISQFNQTSGGPAVAMTAPPVENKIEARNLSFSNSDAAPPIAPPPSPQSVLAGHEAKLTRFLEAIDSVTYYLVHLTTPRSITEQAQLTSKLVTVARDELNSAHGDAKLLMPRSSRVDLKTASLPVPSFAWLRELLSVYEEIAEAATDGMDLGPQNQERVAQALLENWRANGLPNFGDEELAEDIMTASGAISEDVKIAARDLRRELFPAARVARETTSDGSDARGSTPGKPPRKKRGGQTTYDPKEDQRIVNAWKSRRYRSYADLARAMGLADGDVKKAVDRCRKR